MFYFHRLLEFIGFISIIILLSAIFFVNKITEQKLIDTKDKYDAIIILSGNYERAHRASNLFFEKNANHILLSKEQAIIKNYIDPKFSKKTYELYQEILIDNNINPNSITLFGDNNESTFDEVKELKKINLQQYRNILVVTDRYHIYRANLLFQDMNIRSNYDFHRQKYQDEWYKNKESILIILSELAKCYLYYVFGDFNEYLEYI